MRARLRFWAAHALLAAASAGVALALGVLAIQAFYAPPPVVSGWRAPARVHALERNQLGYRGRPIAYGEGDFVILLLGDSHVEANACAYDYLPETRLEHHLAARGRKAKVFSVATGGYGQDQQLLALEEYYRSRRADLVLLWQTIENDIWNNVFPTHWPTNGNPKPTFWLEDGQLRGPSERIGDALPRPRLKVLSLFPALLPSLTRRDTVWEARLPPPYRPLAAYDGPVSREWQMRFDEGFMGWENLDNEKSHYSVHLTPPSERMKYGIELTRRLLAEIEQRVVAGGGRLAIFWVTPPGERRVKDEVYALNGRLYRSAARQMEEIRDAVDAGFTALEVRIAMEKWRVGPANAHLNEHANDEAMANLAAAVAPLIGIPAKP